MVKYKVNLKFKEDSFSLNEKIIEVLKIELPNKFTMIGNDLDKKLPYNYSKLKGSNN